jgi:hypothetical protein
MQEIWIAWQFLPLVGVRSGLARSHAESLVDESNYRAQLAGNVKPPRTAQAEDAPFPCLQAVGPPLWAPAMSSMIAKPISIKPTRIRGAVPGARTA